MKFSAWALGNVTVTISSADWDAPVTTPQAVVFVFVFKIEYKEPCSKLAVSVS